MRHWRNEKENYNVRLLPTHQTGKTKKDGDSITSGSDVGKMVPPELPVGDMSLSDFLGSYMTT